MRNANSDRQINPILKCGPIDTKTQSDYYKAQNVIFRQYNKGGFVIKTIYCDGEYRAMMNKVSDDLDVVMNYTNASDHVPEASSSSICSSLSR